MTNSSLQCAAQSVVPLNDVMKGNYDDIMAAKTQRKQLKLL